ncbi:hypothetical protein DPEC_G00003570 [Dallia pectoralis]|uniref:Uncharacterized protein n=1 Tax=Dallia pectoralis TaxID=75939 RepID=A0ACC2HJ96_DALPE|nr:hypothetical protein DPEC_G00003570 [Dallia pectoralis]
MALNAKVERKSDAECLKSNDHKSEGGDGKRHLLSAAISATSNQNGDQTGSEDGVKPEQVSSERRRSGHTDGRGSNNSPLPGQRPAEELPRRNFQIPRKIKERKGLYNFLPPDSREFENLVKILSTFYLDASSRGTFSYCKARVINNELLEKEFIEKRRELKQEGRTETELAESYCFLFPEKSKLPWICEKGLSVGHSKINTLGNPAMGVYLSKFSDLLQMNPFEPGTCGDIVIFKVMRGRLKNIFDNMPKSVLDPTPKFDCHVLKNATRVTSLLSYRAFELTQQYFYEFAFDEIKSRPRHVCPYAVVSFQYKNKECASAPMTAHRFNSTTCDGGNRGRSSYLVWSGLLVSKGLEVCHVSLRSSSRHFLPFKLPEKLEVTMGMPLDQVKRKIPSVLFSWDTYSGTREVLRCGLYCSLFEVVDGNGRGSAGTISGLIHKLERDRMVLVKPLVDKGFLFLLSSSQMVAPNDRRGRFDKSLQALFVFQESRGVTKPTPRSSEQEPLSAEPQPPLLVAVEPFIPALHYALLKLRSNPDNKHLSTGVERQAHDYLTRKDSGRTFFVPEYQQNLDERGNSHPPPRPRPNIDSLLRSYLHGPSSAYVLPMVKARDMMDRINQPPAAPAPPTTDYSPVSDWGGSGGSDRQERLEKPEKPLERAESSSSRRRTGSSQAHSNGASSQRSRQSQSDYDKEKMKQLLALIQLHKKALVKDPSGKDRAETGDDGDWEGPHGLKRKLEEDQSGAMHKYLRSAHFSNGEPSRDAPGENVEPGNSHLAAVLESMGIPDTDMRDRGDSSQPGAGNETQRLLKILLATLNKAMAQGSAPTTQPDHVESSSGSARQDLLEEQTVTSLASPFSPGSPAPQPHTADNPPSASAPLVEPPPPPNVDTSIPFLDTPTDDHLEQMGVLVGGDGGPSAASLELVQVLREASLERQQTAALERDMVLKGASQVKKGVVGCFSREKDNRVERPAQPPISLDTVLSQEVHSLSSSIQGLMESEKIQYAPPVSPGLVLHHDWQPNSSFSYFVAPYVVSIPVQSHVNALSEKIGRLLPKAADFVTSPGGLSAPGVVAPPPSSLPVPPNHTRSAPAPVHNTASIANLALNTKEPLPLAQSTCVSHKQDTFKQPHNMISGALKPPGDRKSEASASETGDVCSPSQITMASPESASVRPKQAPTPAQPILNHASAAGLLLGQLKPEVFSSLVEIFKDVQKNTVKFYIHSADQEEEPEICVEIKEYLKSLGNTECNPQTFLESNSSLDKLLIIIQNEDISAQVNKIPALVSLKKLSTVSFAGVDSLDDVKNHTYNELFVSGGFIVSDEFVLNPDFITQERLQAFLRFLEEQSSPENPWQWKIHCKSQKKLKELGRMNSDAMALLNLLTAYQKKHLVDFLPYHECDAQSRQAPDLDCLVKLQANHTQHRHIIFLTERRFEMFLQYSRNGIVIANIDDIMTSFHSLIGASAQNELPTPPSTVVHDDCVEEEDMSLDSEDEDTVNQVITEPPAPSQEAPPGGPSQHPPLPDSDEFRPPLPEQLNTLGHHSPSSLSFSCSTAKLSDFAALKSAISQFKASNPAARPGSGNTSPGGFTVNPHQSFLCPSAQWAPYASSSGYPSSPCSATQEQDYRHPGQAHTATLGSNLTTASLGSQATLTLPDIPQPPLPPHLMLTGSMSQMYGQLAAGSFTGSTGAPAGSATDSSSSASLSTAPTYSDPIAASAGSPDPGYPQNNLAQPSYTTGLNSGANGTPTQPGDRTVGGPGEGQWGLGGGMPNRTETPGGSTPGSQGERTPANSVEGGLGVGLVVPPVATRGGSIPRPAHGGIRGGVAGGHPHGRGGYGCMGSTPGHMDGGMGRGGMGRGAMGPGSLGGYRGRGAPPGGPWPRPGGGPHERPEGGGPCRPSWGYPMGRGRGQVYYPDYTYTHNYSP